MKYLLICCILAALGASTVLGAKVGKWTCVNGQPGLDDDMEHTITFKCPMDMTAIDPSEVSGEMTEEMMDKLMIKVLAPQWKCIYTLLKAVDEKGKLLPKMAEKYGDCFPQKIQANIKGKIAACVKANNPKLKKEAGTKAKSWEPMSGCMWEVLNINPC